TDFTPIGVGRLVVLTLLAITAMALAHLASALGVRGAGGSRWAMVGALVGALVGLTVPPLGLLLGPLLGAIAVELWRTHRLAESIRVGVGAVVGGLAGIVADVAWAFRMVVLFAWWVGGGWGRGARRKYGVRAGGKASRRRRRWRRSARSGPKRLRRRERFEPAHVPPHDAGSRYRSP